MIKLFNTLSRKVEEFKPVRKNQAKIYTCGPTVYNFAHIGNLRTYIFEDILRRVLEYGGYQVTQAMNITDVGHLTSDADEGEDKMDAGAAREKKHPLEIAKKYESAFFEDLKKLNILLPTKISRATETIKDQIAIIKKLETQSCTYRTARAIYFDTSKFAEYGKLSGQKLGEKKTAARDDVKTDSEKRHAADFALWFFLAGRYKNHILHWPSPWGEGFPGWHIECSAISRKLLGQPFDIHCGGEDHIGTHHENEIAQSEAAYKKPLANFWMHGRFLQIDSSKMAKSSGKFITLNDLIKNKFSPLAFRYFALGAHYRNSLNFTWESLENAQNSLDNLYEKISELLGPATKPCPDYSAAFLREIENDLDTPRALSLTWRLIKKENLDGLKLATLEKFDKVLGLDLMKGAEEKKKIPQEIRALVKERENYRKEKKYDFADGVRKKIEGLGYTVKDTAEGAVIRKI